MFSRSTIETVNRILLADPGAETQDVDLVMDVVRKGREGRAVWVRAKEAAEILGICRVEFWRRIKTGRYQLTVRRDGKRSVFYSRQETKQLGKP